MTYDLLIGQRGHSSWSLRGWLPFAVFGIDVSVKTTRLYSEAFKAEVAAFGGAGSVPVAKTPGGAVLTDSLAIAWHLAEAFPDRGLLPTDPTDRAEAQSLIAEMHSGFSALRGASVAFEGLEARRVEVQCAVTPGLPGFSIVGLPDKAVSEARERVRTALQAMAIALPSKRITVNLSPADLPKEGSHFDLPIALALLAALDIVPRREGGNAMALGELSLDGRAGAGASARCPPRSPRARTTASCCAPPAAGPRRPGSARPRSSPRDTLADLIAHLTDRARWPPPARRGRRDARHRLPVRGAGPGTRQARAGNRRRRAAPPADGRQPRARANPCWPRACPA
jgi:glutathione S-transferase